MGNSNEEDLHSTIEKGEKNNLEKGLNEKTPEYSQNQTRDSFLCEL